jgi:uncharacterized paraquat-inducible protein A
VNALLALVLTAMIVFVQANLWPIVTLGLNGQFSGATLWGTIIAMWQEQAQVISVLAAATLFFFPLDQDAAARLAAVVCTSWHRLRTGFCADDGGACTTCSRGR